MLNDYALILVISTTVLIVFALVFGTRKTKKQPQNELFIPEDKWS